MTDTHPGISCSYCKVQPIKHTRYTCLVCANHNLCEMCYDLKRVSGQHRSYHPTQKVAPMTQLRIQHCTPDTSHIYCCPFCGDLGFTAKTLLNHVDRLHFRELKLVHCPVCVVHQAPSSVGRILQSDLLVHFYAVHHELSDVAQCGVCSSSSIRYGCLVCENYQLCTTCHQNKTCSKSHRAYHPMQPIPPLTANRANLEQQLFVCPYCGKKDYTTSLLVNHCNLRHPNDTSAVRCPVCIVRRIPCGFQTLLNSQEPGQLRKHLMQAHDWAGDEECSICMEKISSATCKNLHCGHTFHVKCISQWLEGRSSSCPICRKIVVMR